MDANVRIKIIRLMEKINNNPNFFDNIKVKARTKVKNK